MIRCNSGADSYSLDERRRNSNSCFILSYFGIYRLDFIGDRGVFLCPGKEELMEEQFMRRAIELAKQGLGWTSPNPMVGAVIVKDGRVIGEGYHHRCGELHAERNALAACSEDPAGATMYVTLEPCCHTGRTPPCT